ALGDQRYDVALDAFERALALFDFPTLRLGRARALAGLGRFVEASEEYRTILNGELDDSEQLRRVERDADKELGEVKAKIGHVTLEVTPRDASLTLDGKQLSPAMFGVPFPIDPGEHELIASHEGHTGFEKRVHVESGATISVPVALIPSVVPQPAPQPEPERPPRESGTTMDPQAAQS